MKRILATCLFAVLVSLAAAVRSAEPKTLQILFIGNSLTYVGNLPAVFSALAAGNGHAVRADMLVKGGATLTQWLDSGAVQNALMAQRYAYVVLQERGNDFACGFGPQVCRDSRRSLRALAHIVRANGAEPVLLGTYEPDPSGSAALVMAESKAAHANAMPYLAVSNRMNVGRKQFAQANWFWKDGMHPGHALVLLEAVLLYRQLYGILPQAKTFVVRAPMFVPGSKFSGPAPRTLPLPGKPVAVMHPYTSETMLHVLELTGSH